MRLSDTFKICAGLCDRHEAQTTGSAMAEFNAEDTKAALLKVQREGFNVRAKTDREIYDECREYDLKNGVKRYIATTPPKKRGRKNTYSDEQRKALLDAVHAGLESGIPTKQACKDAGLNYKVFLAWRYKYNINHPPLTGRVDNWKGGAK